MLNYQTLTVVPALPLSRWSPAGGEDVFRGLQGATIIEIGAPLEEGEGLEGGGLVVDYRPKGSSEQKRVVFAFNENGMWILFSGALPDQET